MAVSVYFKSALLTVLTLLGGLGIGYGINHTNTSSLTSLPAAEASSLPGQDASTSSSVASSGTLQFGDNSGTLVVPFSRFDDGDDDRFEGQRFQQFPGSSNEFNRTFRGFDD